MKRHTLPLLVSLIMPSIIFGQINLIWDSNYNGSGDFNDRYNCIKKDVQGNIYAAGSSVYEGKDRDLLLTKLDANGNLIWNKMLNGSANGPDEIQAIALDQTGNIYVTGFIKNNVTSQDLVTVKFNSNGDTLWLKTYDYVNEYDQGNSIEVDNNGNVYVTGQSDSDPTGFLNDDYITIKYSSNGNLIWFKRFNGTGNAIDRSVKIVLDDQNNCYITGRSDNGNDDDYVTIKYNNQGTQQWIKFDDRGGRDRATGLAISKPSNRIYITGKSDNGNNYDYWTICYDFNGNLLWNKPFDFVDDDNATAIVADANGNCFVTGESDANPSPTLNYDFQTVAYSASGNLLWQSRFAGASGNDDSPNDLCLVNGFLYVTGNQDSDPTIVQNKQLTVVSYNNVTGLTNWNTSFAPSPYLQSNGYGITPDGTGVVAVGYLDGTIQQKNGVALRIDPNGTVSWDFIYNGVGDNNDNIHAIVVDNNDMVYAAGYLVENSKNKDFAMVKFNSSGNAVCTQTIDGNSVGSVDDAQGILLDNLGNPVLAGYLKNKSTSNDLQLVKFNPSTCDTIWTKTLDGTGHGSDKNYDITKDINGFIYVTGREDADPTNASNDNCYTAKLDANGTMVWQQSYNSLGTNEDRGVSLRVSNTGNVYVAGRSWNGTDYDIFLIKYNNSGVQQWIQHYHGGFGNDEPKELVIDANEQILIAGRSEEVMDSVFDYVILKYTNTGTLTWSYKYNGSGFGNDEAQGISVDSQGNSAIIGLSDQDSTANINYDMVVIYLNANGSPVWTSSYNGQSNLEDIGDDVAFNNFGQVYTTGHTNKGSNSYPNYDIITRILDPNGGLLWSNIFNGSSDSSDIPNVIYLKNNDFYIGGSTKTTNEMRNMLLLKYSGTVGISPISVEQSIAVFPNPFQDELNFIIPELWLNSTLEIFEMNGRIVYQGKLSESQSAVHLSNLMAGAYLYRIQGIQQNTIFGMLQKTN